MRHVLALVGRLHIDQRNRVEEWQLIARSCSIVSSENYDVCCGNNPVCKRSFVVVACVLVGRAGLLPSWVASSGVWWEMEAALPICSAEIDTMLYTHQSQSSETGLGSTFGLNLPLDLTDNTRQQITLECGPTPNGHYLLASVIKFAQCLQP